MTLELLDHLIVHLPPTLHLVLISRTRPELRDLPRWRLQGRVLGLEQAELAFQPREIAELFQERFLLPLEASTLEHLVAQTEGWPMALPLLAERMQEGLADGPPSENLRDRSTTAREVLCLSDGRSSC
jgi:ATP/maltotriose-dependent transcriptional regulator MalT